jgi:hypothetical protein
MVGRTGRITLGFNEVNSDVGHAPGASERRYGMSFEADRAAFL